MLKPFLLFATLSFVAPLRPGLAPLNLVEPLQDKNFYLLSLIQRDTRSRSVLAADPELAALTKAKSNALGIATRGTTIGKVAGLEDLRFSADESNRIGNRLAALASQLKPLIDELRQSHAYERDAELADPQFIAKAWKECADGMNLLVGIYGTQTESGRSSEINGPLYKPTDPYFGALVKTLLGVISEDRKTAGLFFEPTLDVSVGLMRCQLRDEAGRFEPMEKGVNRPAFKHVKRIDWSKFPYSSILVPGFGPEEAGVRLSPAGRLGCALAAKRFRDHQAPFLIVSGGYVHPNRTPYSEAIEMKACLMDEFGIPEDAILVDPHARHTTTNIRNAVRLIARYGMPTDKAAMVVTNEFQASDICAPAFQVRCNSIFGFQPGLEYKRLSTFEVSYRPNLISLSIDPTDPLDP